MKRLTFRQPAVHSFIIEFVNKTGVPTKVTLKRENNITTGKNFQTVNNGGCDTNDRIIEENRSDKQRRRSSHLLRTGYVFAIVLFTLLPINR